MLLTTDFSYGSDGFFQMSEGRWISQRTTHHLAMRRTELGQLEINASVLPATDSKVVEICQMHDVDPARAIGVQR